MMTSFSDVTSSPLGQAQAAKRKTQLEQQKANKQLL
jgi:hypothetical protein